MIDTGDTNRWVKELTAFGLHLDKTAERDFAELFRQVPRPE
jgi:hypothetical protein